MDRVLEAAKQLAQPFHKHSLVVRAWQLSKQTLGLYGFEELHPDRNKILSCLCGAKGLVALGLIRRLKPDWFEVVSYGRR